MRFPIEFVVLLLPTIRAQSAATILLGLIASDPSCSVICKGATDSQIAASNCPDNAQLTACACPLFKGPSDCFKCSQTLAAHSSPAVFAESHANDASFNTAVQSCINLGLLPASVLLSSTPSGSQVPPPAPVPVVGASSIPAASVATPLPPSQFLTMAVPSPAPATAAILSPVSALRPISSAIISSAAPSFTLLPLPSALSSTVLHSTAPPLTPGSNSINSNSPSAVTQPLSLAPLSSTAPSPSSEAQPAATTHSSAPPSPTSQSTPASAGQTLALTPFSPASVGSSGNKATVGVTVGIMALVGVILV